MLFSLILLISQVLAAVEVLDDSNFDKRIVGDPGSYSLVYFNSPYCRYCRQLDPQFEPLGDLYKGTKLRVFKIDALHNKKVRARFGIQTFPNVQLLSNEGKQVSIYAGFKETRAMIDFITERTGVNANKIESHVVKLGGGNDIKDAVFESEKDVFVAFYEPWDKSFGNLYVSYFEELADQYPDKLFVGIDVSEPESTDLVRYFQAAQYPVVYSLPKDRGEKYVVYRLDEPDAEKTRSLIEGKQIGQSELNLEQLERESQQGMEGIDYDDDDDDYDLHIDL